MIVAIVGIIGNIIFILIFSCHAKKINTFHSLMVCMAYFDTIYLSSSMFIFAVPLLWPPISQTFLFTHSITLLLPTAHIGINGRKKDQEPIINHIFARINFVDHQLGFGEICDCVPSILQNETYVCNGQKFCIFILKNVFSPILNNLKSLKVVKSKKVVWLCGVMLVWVMVWLVV